jgi:hypothetical protein
MTVAEIAGEGMLIAGDVAAAIDRFGVASVPRRAATVDHYTARAMPRPRDNRSAAPGHATATRDRPHRVDPLVEWRLVEPAVEQRRWLADDPQHPPAAA